MQISSSSYCSDKESDCSQGNRGEEANVGVVCIVKARAGRGPASNPQNLYAKRRREKINDKLRVLQKLVPNGTKVDLSTMLEEAVLYVKFLKLQIKVVMTYPDQAVEPSHLGVAGLRVEKMIGQWELCIVAYSIFPFPNPSQGASY
ncbi:transcription factor RSL2-like [Hordeum vulgare subsp. vulgare]|uniref:transcription factor RSL2-like n=1 Tax=Hordeum vulgare subsp. vulgare TaxID=112509 RepID=UPI001D1A44B6|nr:transcription factor RSL2-like [Hordeum vulgare subsp. vulgare]